MRKRRSIREAHPVHDFLFTYYNFTAGKLEQWHPGIGHRLESETPLTRFDTCEGGVSYLDPESIPVEKRRTFRFIHNLLTMTAARPANYGCYGLHEWAMIYQGDDIRHKATTPLRLPQTEIDVFVRSRPICCSHYDAFRFFAPAARPLNRLQPTLADREQNEQPACLHANMDIYKWAYKCMPWIGSDLLMDCFELAVEIRALDMMASPYDLSAYGYDAVKIETPEGRATYEIEQRRFATRAQLLRKRLITALRPLCEPALA